MRGNYCIRIVRWIFRLMARGVLYRYHPIIIGVTGSVGKTTTKEAIYHVLSDKFYVRRSSKNYNNEIGVPLTILGLGSPSRSIVRWSMLCVQWVMLMTGFRKYPEVLVLEMAVDRPGDMAYLLSIVKPNIAVVTGISSSHIAYFGSLRSIAKEKGELVKALNPDGCALLNRDDDRTWKMRKKTKARCISYGFDSDSDLRAFNAVLSIDDRGVHGMNLKLDYRGKIIPVRLRKVLSRHHVYAVLAGLAVAESLQINLIEAAQRLENFQPPKGRLRPVRAIRESWIIDDSYNASPASTLAALEVLENFPNNSKVAVLGDMLELGSEEASGHRMLAKKVLESKVTQVYLIGERMKFLGEELIKEGFPPDAISQFEIPMDAAGALRANLTPKSIVLVKGSQGMRMEMIVESLMADPSDAQKTLCRQDVRWRETPFVKP